MNDETPLPWDIHTRGGGFRFHHRATATEAHSNRTRRTSTQLRLGVYVMESPQRYRTIVIDPPWPQKGAGTLRGREGWHDAQGASMPLKYNTMTLPEITALPIRELADPAGSHLYLWTTNGFLPAAFDVLSAWGYRYSTTLVWAKKPMGGGLGGAYGISTEFCLFARRGLIREDAKRPKVVGTWWPWKRPYDERGKPKSSAKPPEFRGVVEAASPGPYLEMFARDTHPGWDAWGNQAPNAIRHPALDGIAS